MKLTCDLCGGVLEMRDGRTSAVCCNCGMEYGEDRLREKLSEIQPPAVKTLPVRDVPPARDVSYKKRSPAAAKKELKKMKVMWIIFAAICLFAFIGTLAANSGQQELIVLLVSLGTMLLTLVVFKPWKVYGGKAI